MIGKQNNRKENISFIHANKIKTESVVAQLAVILLLFTLGSPSLHSSSSSSSFSSSQVTGLWIQVCHS
jgi:hypothetical protein